MSVVSAKFQVVIPPEIRQAIGIKPGMRVRFEREGKGAVLRIDAGVGVPPSDPESGFGMVKVPRALSIEEINGATWRGAE